MIMIRGSNPAAVVSDACLTQVKRFFIPRLSSLITAPVSLEKKRWMFLLPLCLWLVELMADVVSVHLNSIHPKI